jgi:CubicO group peptidase (beta-lactamase class C family)
MTRQVLLGGIGLVLAASAFGAARPADDLPRTGRTEGKLLALDELMTSFLTGQKIPGGALAVAKDGKLVYARGFGWADRDAKAPVQPDSLFRIASISKPITAVAILQLVDAGKIKLDDPAFALLKLHPHLPDGAKVDPRLKTVTVRHLLQHAGGWDRDKSGDPMFRSVKTAEALNVPPPATAEHVIRYMMGRPLDFDPGERMLYSNFGYCVLGRVIEAVSGTTYERYVQEKVLAPLGIRSMRIGRSLAENRAPGEVKYYTPDAATAPCIFPDKRGKRVPVQYGRFHVEAADAHGGWLASAVDLVRFAAAFDKPDACPVLSAGGIRTMFARPAGALGHDEKGKPKPAFYACGWMVRPIGRKGVNTWHAGGIPGTATLLVRRHDGFTWAVLFNTRGKNTIGKIDPLVHHAVNAVKAWPDGDLFREYRKGPRD